MSIRLLALLSLTLPALAQQQPPSDAQLLQALLVEVRQLRLAIEKSTLAGARLQIATQRLQVHETRISRLTAELDQVRRSIDQGQTEQTRLTEHLKNLETETNQQPDPKLRRDMEGQLKDRKLFLEGLKVTDQQRRTRESELALQLQAEQARWNEVNDALLRLERSLSTPASP